MDPSSKDKEYSQFFPVTMKSPFIQGAQEVKWGARSVSRGDPKGISKIAAGIIGCTPGVNYLVANIRRTLAINSPQKLMDERRKEVQRELDSESVKLQQVYFETHNSALPGKLPSNSSLRKLLDCSFPDRQLAVLVRDLESFIEITPEGEEKKLLEKQVAILKKMEPLATVISCYVLAQNEEQRKSLRNEAKAMILEQFQEMKDNDVLLLPFGYMDSDVRDLKADGTAGHIALIEAKRSGNVCDLRVFNSGDGIDHHVQGPTRSHAYPFKAAGFDIAGIKEAELDAIVENILATNQDDFNASYTVMKGDASQDSSEAKAYRTQVINNCPKKSLQIWLHDQLRSTPELYQKFRIFALDQRKRELDSIIESHPGPVIRVKHSVALWGGSDRVQNVLHNIYYKVRGFFSGPHVKGDIPQSDLALMSEYCNALHLSREARLHLLQNNPQEAINRIKTAPPLQRFSLLEGLRQFCKKHKLDASLPFKDLFSREDIDAIISDKKSPKLKIAQLLIDENELEEAVAMAGAIDPDHHPFELNRKLLTALLKEGTHLNIADEVMQKEITYIGDRLQTNSREAAMLAMELLPYRRENGLTLLTYALYEVQDNHNYYAIIDNDLLKVAYMYDLSLGDKWLEPTLKGLENLPNDLKVTLFSTLATQIAPFKPERAVEIAEKAMDFAIKGEYKSLFNGFSFINSSTWVDQSFKDRSVEKFISKMNEKDDKDMPKVHSSRYFQDLLTALLEYNLDKGKTFIETLLESVEKSSQDKHDNAFESIATSLAPYDPNLALQIADRIGSNEQKEFVLSRIKQG